MLKFFKGKFKNLKLEYVVVIILLIGIVVASVTVFGGRKSSESGESDTFKYVSEMETKLEKVLSKVEGAGKVSVVITVSTGIMTDIAKEEKSVTENGKTTVSTSPVLVSGKPIVLREIFPEITGVLIVAKGAGDIRVKMSLLDAATTTLGITCDKIQILNQ